MVKLALTMSSFDRSRPRRHFDSDAAPEPKLGPAAFRVRVASERVALGAVPAAFREWRSHASWRRPGMRVPAVLGTVALHAAALALIFIVERSLVAPVPIPAIEVSLNFEAAPQPAVSAARESVPEPVPAPASPPDEAPAAPEPPTASEPPAPPVAMAPPDPPVAPPAEAVPQSAALPPQAVAKPPPPKPPAVPKTRVNAPRQPPHRAPPPSIPSPESAVAAVAPPAPATPQPALLASVPIVPPQPVYFGQGNPEPNYPMTARIRGLQGLVLLHVDVAPSGTPIAVTVATSSGHPILDEAAVAAVRTWRFRPATQAGVPVAAFADVPIHFSIAN